MRARSRQAVRLSVIDHEHEAGPLDNQDCPGRTHRAEQQDMLARGLRQPRILSRSNAAIYRTALLVHPAGTEAFDNVDRPQKARTGSRTPATRRADPHLDLEPAVRVPLQDGLGRPAQYLSRPVSTSTCRWWTGRRSLSARDDRPWDTYFTHHSVPPEPVAHRAPQSASCAGLVVDARATRKRSWRPSTRRARSRRSEASGGRNCPEDHLRPRSRASRSETSTTWPAEAQKSKGTPGHAVALSSGTSISALNESGRVPAG